jgi:ubiquinone/menaquinone biosynthesis C-methylase UbiE
LVHSSILKRVSKVNFKKVNDQYNVAPPASLPVKIAAYQRKKMYELFLDLTRISSCDSVLDIGVTADQTYEASNYFEAWYPHKNRITAVGLDDASFLETLYEGLKFVRANGLNLPFEDNTFDYVHSSAVLEHVGNLDNQKRFIEESYRVARKGVFITTPNRWFPVEFHTVLPLIHWLPKSTFRSILSNTPYSFFSKEENLNLLTPAEVKRIMLISTASEPKVQTLPLWGWPSNIIAYAPK